MKLRSVSMKPARLVLMAGAFAAVAACVPRREPVPQPQPQPPVRQPVQQLPPPPPPAATHWRDLPLTTGGWSYSNQGGTSQASFGPANAEASFTVRCDRAARRVTLSRAGTGGGSAMVVRTTSTSRSLPVSAQAEPPAFVSATLPASDPLLDAMAFSRGRFTVEAAGAPMLVIPAWPEPARVVEDCRG
jgi:hypothetical protein